MKHALSLGEIVKTGGIMANGRTAEREIAELADREIIELFNGLTSPAKPDAAAGTGKETERKVEAAKPQDQKQGRFKQLYWKLYSDIAGHEKKWRILESRA